MSEFSKIPVGKEALNVEVTPEFPVYSGVEILDNGKPVIIGDDTGRVISIPGITAEQAETIRGALSQSGFQYQPYTATDAILNPAAEIGDGVTVNNTYSGIYKMSKNFTPLMKANIEAPADEEVDHEYPYEPKQDRVYQRAIAENKAQISLTQKHIASEVTRASEAEGELNSLITQTAGSINAEVSKKVGATGGSSSTFGWNLNSTSWSLYSNSSTVFKATANGVEVTGKITASSGKIGGFEIGGSFIRSNSSMTMGVTGTTSGVYFGTNGIHLRSYNKSNNTSAYFKVTTNGNIEASNLALKGTLNIGGTDITASTLRSGAQSAYNNGSAWTTGANNGNTVKSKWDNATSYTGSYPTVFRATHIVGIDTVESNNGNFAEINSKVISWKQVTIGGETFYVLKGSG